MLKFLATFAAYDGSATSKVVAKGVNDAAPLIVEHELDQALVATDTLKVKAPAGFEDWVPQLVAVFTPAAPRVSQLSSLAVTSHSSSTGETTLTASDAVAINATVTLAYYPSTTGS